MKNEGEIKIPSDKQKTHLPLDSLKQFLGDQKLRKEHDPQGNV